jgi:hypothetical protein
MGQLAMQRPCSMRVRDAAQARSVMLLSLTLSEVSLVRTGTAVAAGTAAAGPRYRGSGIRACRRLGSARHYTSKRWGEAAAAASMPLPPLIFQISQVPTDASQSCRCIMMQQAACTNRFRKHH